ncbi:MAG: translation initiation factor IF-2 N-terminal domain-containing protein, partial [Alistipes sp.]|nr:translation initiation factor IF-2 N-terminal domain-containing protein [Alistipes sp.]
MTNNRKIRLIQVAKEFKVGLSSITDFLLKKGVGADLSPNSPVSPEVYAMLEKEFGSNRSITGNERDNIRERISMNKQAAVTLNAEKKDKTDDEEVIIKSNVISVKEEVPQPKILGKIDLEPKKKEQPKPEPKKEEPKPQPKPEPEQPKAEPKKETAPVAEKPAEAATEPKKDNIFRPNQTQLAGPQILGTMDVSGMVPGGKHKRKRLDKEKVDVAKQGNKEGGKKDKKNKPAQGQPNQPQQNQNQPKPGEGRRNKKKDKHQPKPVVRPEVSDEEVSKQIKDTLARLTAKGAKNKGAKYRKEKREEIREKMSEEMEREQMERSVLKVTEFVTVSELATMMNVSPMEVISACMNLGLMVSINQRLDA